MKKWKSQNNQWLGKKFMEVWMDKISPTFCWTLSLCGCCPASQSLHQKTVNHKKKQKKQGKGTNDHILSLDNWWVIWNDIFHCLQDYFKRYYSIFIAHLLILKNVQSETVSKWSWNHLQINKKTFSKNRNSVSKVWLMFSKWQPFPNQWTSRLEASYGTLALLYTVFGS